MLTVSGLSKSYGRQTLFEDVAFQVAPGERVGLVGRNGHGKSTLFKILLGQEEADEGQVSFPSGYRIGHLAQHIHFTHKTVLEEAASALPPREDYVDESYKAKAILAGLGFSESDFDRAPSEFSGGYQVRLNLARVLLSDPNLLLLDEPTNYLDIVSIRWLRRFLCAWQGALMIITHDRDFMDSVTTHTMLIHRSKVRKLPGGTEKIYAQILMEEEIHEQTRQNDEKKRAQDEAFINRFRAQATKARAVQSRIKLLSRHEKLDKLQEIKDLDFRFTEAPFTGKFMMEVRDLSFGYDPKHPLIEGLSFAVSKGDKIAVVGPNGRGKTTLLRLLEGELSPQKGVAKPSQNLKVGYFGQTNVDRLSPRLTVEEEVRQANTTLSRTQVRTLCGCMMFEGDSALKQISVLSGGEKSRVLLGRILATPVNLLLLDEPTNHLDQDTVDAFIEAVEAFEGAVVIVTHVERVLSALATKLIVFDGGKVELFDGGYADFLDRVGWVEERDGELAKAKKAAKPAAAVREPQGNPKEARKKRADLVARRSKETSGLRKSIEALEAEIESLEKQIARDDEAMIAASMKGDGQAARQLSASNSAAREKIETLFEELAALEVELNDKDRTFDLELRKLGDA
jgi:ATP-binding cassette subfamily F protein 3